MIKMPIWRNCECGQCNYQYIANMGSFYQGTGFRPEEVELINKAFEALKEKEMTKYTLVMKDHSGRGIKSILSFDNEADREAHVKRSMRHDGAIQSDYAEMLEKLERGEEAEFEATSYEYFNVVEN